VKLIEYLWFIVLGLGVMFLMSRRHGGMGCCGGGHGDHHSGNSEHDHPSGRESRSLQKDVIDLREDQYAIMTSKHQGLSSGPSAEHQEINT
jgi:hypothetical protein